MLDWYKCLFLYDVSPITFPCWVNNAQIYEKVINLPNILTVKRLIYL